MAILYYVVTSYSAEGETTPGVAFSLDDSGPSVYIGHTVGWPAVFGATGYRLYRGTGTPGVYGDGYLDFAGNSNTGGNIGTPLGAQADPTFTAGTPPGSSNILITSTTVGSNTGFSHPTDSGNAWFLREYLWMRDKEILFGDTPGSQISGSDSSISLQSISGTLSSISLSATTVSVSGTLNVSNNLAVTGTGNFQGIVTCQSSLMVNTGALQAGFEFDVFGKSFLDGEVHIDAGVVIGNSYATIETPPTDGIKVEGLIEADDRIEVGNQANQDAAASISAWGGNISTVGSYAHKAWYNLETSEGDATARYAYFNAGFATSPNKTFGRFVAHTRAAERGDHIFMVERDADNATVFRVVREADDTAYVETATPAGSEGYRFEDELTRELYHGPYNINFAWGDVGANTGFHNDFGLLLFAFHASLKSIAFAPLKLPATGKLSEVALTVKSNGGTGTGTLATFKLFRRAYSAISGATPTQIGSTATITQVNRDTDIEITINASDHVIVADSQYFIEIEGGDNALTSNLYIGAYRAQVKIDTLPAYWRF